MSDTGCWATTCKVCRKRYRWDGPMVPVPKCPYCHPAATPAALELPPDVREVLDQAEEILRLCDEEMPEAGYDYAESVAEQTEAIMATIQKSNRVTPRQAQAIANMLAGVEAWIHHD
jgi:hypothetical protein